MRQARFLVCLLEERWLWFERLCFQRNDFVRSKWKRSRSMSYINLLLASCIVFARTLFQIQALAIRRPFGLLALGHIQHSSFPYSFVPFLQSIILSVSHHFFLSLTFSVLPSFSLCLSLFSRSLSPATFFLSIFTFPNMFTLSFRTFFAVQARS